MPQIRFSIQVDTEDEEPSRVIREIDGAVFEYAGESDKEEQIGTLQCFLVQPGLAEEKDVSLFDAMDSISDAAMECYEALFDPETDEWSDSVQELYSGGPTTVTLVVHGVGDHSHVEIVAEAYESFRRVMPGGYAISCPTVEFDSSFKYVFGHHASARSRNQMILVLQSESRKHVVIPVDWSHLRSRAGTPDAALAVASPLQFLSTRIIQMAQVCVDIFRCVPRARVIWRVPLAFVG